MSVVLPPDRGPAQPASGFSAEWLAAQRWFRRKSRRVAEVAVHDAAPLGGDGWLLVLSATNEDGAEDRYLVPAVADGDRFREPRDGEGVWLRLAVLMADGAELRAEHGRFIFSAASALRRLLPGGPAGLLALGERRLGVEQSNTSIALGDQLILKCYRLLEPGASVEIEVNAFLTNVRFSGAPRLGGRADYLPDSGPLCAVAMLQEMVVSPANGWRWALDHLAGSSRGRTRAVEGIGGLGTLTRAMHTALASRPEVPGFPSRSAAAPDLIAWHARATQQLEAALDALHGAAQKRLLAVAPALRGGLDAILGAGASRVTRIHGDYHLGQVLRTARGFKVIDFEGEPARPLNERRRKSSPLRDVAGMIRSIDYASFTAVRHLAEARPAAEPRMLQLAEAWRQRAVDGFRAAYRKTMRGCAAYPANKKQAREMVAFFTLEKAIYEVSYELANRPGWADIPLKGVLGILGRFGEAERAAAA